MGSAHGPFYAASLTFPRNLSLPSTRPFYSARKQLGSLPGHAVTAKLRCTPSEACASPQGADRTTRERPGGTVPPETPSSQQPAWEKRWGPCVFQQREALSEQLAALAGPSWALGGHPLGSRTYLWPNAFLCWLMWHHPAPCGGLRDALTVALTARPCPVWPGDAGISAHRLQQEIYFLWRAVRPAAERVSECPCWEGGGRCGGAVYTLCPSLEHVQPTARCPQKRLRRESGNMAQQGVGFHMAWPRLQDAVALQPLVAAGVGGLCVNVRRVLHCSIWMPKLYSAVKVN